MACKRHDMLTESFERVLAFGLRAPDDVVFGSYFPNLPEPVVHALLDLHRQVLQHVHINSQAEFADICGEYGVEHELAEIEAMCSPASILERRSCKDPAAKAVAAEVQARISTKQAEVAHLQLELARIQGECDALRSCRDQRRGQVEQLAAGYRSVAASMKQVYEASKGYNLGQAQRVLANQTQVGPSPPKTVFLEIDLGLHDIMYPSNTPNFNLAGVFNFAKLEDMTTWYPWHISQPDRTMISKYVASSLGIQFATSGLPLGYGRRMVIRCHA